MRVNQQQAQEESEAKTFVFNFIRQLDPNLADEYKDEAFSQSQSQQNLEKMLSTLPPNFMDDLILTKVPKTDFKSLIYNPRNFSILENSPQNRKNLLLLRYISKIKLTHRIIGHNKCVRLILHDPAQQFFLTVSADKTLKLWHLHSLTLMHTYKGHEHDVITAEISPNRTLFASISNDQSVRVWSLINGRCIDKITDHNLWPFNCVAFSPCSRYLAIASEHDSVVIRSVNDVDHMTPPNYRIKVPIVKSVILNGPVRCCCFSPGGKMIAAAIHSGSLVVFTVHGSMKWTADMTDNPCDFCFFHPFTPYLVFAFSSKAGNAMIYKIGDKLSLVDTFKVKRTFPRMQNCLFALSCDASLLFACSSTQFIAWNTRDSRVVVGKTENLPSAKEVSPNPVIPYIVAIVCKNSVLIFNVETSKTVNTLHIPDTTWKMIGGNWSESGLDFYATDTDGGVYVFRQSQNDQPTCHTIQYFFPNDFTNSIWDPLKGEIEEDSELPSHLTPKDVLCDGTGNVVLQNYRPHLFEDIYHVYSPPPALNALSEIENRFLATCHSEEVIVYDESSNLSTISDHEISIKVNNVNIEPEAVSSSESSKEEEPEELNNSKPTNRYPFWTTIDSATHGNYFPQVGDRIVYIKEGHLQMIKDDPDLGKSVRPSIKNENYWPNIAVFEVQEVRHGKFSCEIDMNRVILSDSCYNSSAAFYEEISQIENNEVAEDEPIRTLEYPISNAPAFLVLADQYISSINAFKKMSKGDRVEVFFKLGDSEEVYQGKIVDKTESSDNIANYNSILVSWGDGSEDDKYSPWEIFSYNKHEIYVPQVPTSIENQCKAVTKVLTTAQSLRSLRPFFKQPFFVRTIIYPSDFGLIRRRLQNKMYRNIISLKFDINNVLETINSIPNSTSTDICYVELLIERLNNVIDDPENVSEYSNFKDFDDDVADYQERKEKERIKKERELRDKRKSIYAGQDDFAEDTDSDDNFKPNASEDSDDMPYQETKKTTFRSPNHSKPPSSPKKKYRNDDDDDFEDDSDGFRETQEDTMYEVSLLKQGKYSRNSGSPQPNESISPRRTTKKRSYRDYSSYDEVEREPSDEEPEATFTDDSYSN